MRSLYGISAILCRSCAAPGGWRLVFWLGNPAHDHRPDPARDRHRYALPHGDHAVVLAAVRPNVRDRAAAAVILPNRRLGHRSPFLLECVGAAVDGAAAEVEHLL